MANALLIALAFMGQAGQPAAQSPNAPPADEYGYVAWCYGALGSYVSLYDRVMPEVTRIEKAFPGPEGVAAALKTYPEIKAQAQKDLKTYSSAITAAEKASPRPISEYGGAQVKRGASIWGGADSVDKARLAQMWMSWEPPSDCEKRAKTLEVKSTILGKALNYNSTSAINQPTEAPPAPAPQEAPAPAPEPPAMPKSDPIAEPTPAPKAEPAKAAPAKTTPAKTAKPLTPTATKPVAAKTPTPKAAAPKAAAKAETIVDPANPTPCAGSLVPAKRGGKDVLICKAD